MNASDLLLDQWTQQVKELFPMLHTYQQHTLAFVVQAIMESGTAVMQRVAEEAWEHLSSDTKIPSIERRLQRFVENEKIEVEPCWSHFLHQTLPFWRGKAATLILDLTPYTDQFTIVYLGLLVKSRVLPLGWRIMPQQEKWEQRQWDLVKTLFEQSTEALSGAKLTLLADRGLSSLALVKLCQHVGWHFVLRIKNEDWCRRFIGEQYQDWQMGTEVLKHPTEKWYGQVLLWKEHAFPIWLSACWDTENEEAWLLISDQGASAKRKQEYRLRMRVESTFQDHKSRGFLIECSRFTHRSHLHRWLFAVFLACWWMARLGRSCIHHGHRHELDRSDRRDKGLFRLGRLRLKSILKRANQDLGQIPLGTILAQLAHSLPFRHRHRRLAFSLYLH